MALQIAARSPPAPSSSLDHRLERERHVGAGVAVGHGVDVEPVDAGSWWAAAASAVAETTTARRSSAPRRVEGRHRGRWYHGPPSARSRRPPGWRSATAPSLAGGWYRSSDPVPAVRYRGHGSGVRDLRQAPVVRHDVSHSHRRTKRRWNPNIQRIRAVVDGRTQARHVCTSCIKAGQGRQGRPLSASGRPTTVQGVIKSYDPGTGDGVVHLRHRPHRVRPRRRRARGLGLPHAPPGPAGGLRPRRRRRHGPLRSLRSGSEVDMGTPGFGGDPRTSSSRQADVTLRSPRRPAQATIACDQPQPERLKELGRRVGRDPPARRRRVVRRLRGGVRPPVRSCSSTAAPSRR